MAYRRTRCRQIQWAVYPDMHHVLVCVTRNALVGFDTNAMFPLWIVHEQCRSLATDYASGLNAAVIGDRGW